MKPAQHGVWLGIAVLTTPFLCYGMALLLAWFYPGVGKVQFEVENGTRATLYLTLVEGATDTPRPVVQGWAVRVQGLPLASGRRRVFMYDALEQHPLGLVVCRDQGSCRWLPYTGAKQYRVTDWPALASVPTEVQVALRSAPRFDFTRWMMLLLSGVPVLAWWLWWKKGRGHPPSAAP